MRLLLDGRTRAVAFLLGGAIGASTLAASMATAASAASLGARGAEPIMGKLTVERSRAGAVFAKVTGASARYAPMRGAALPRMSVKAPARPPAYSHDLTYYGGPTVGSESSYDLYVNCPGFSSCWGAPGTFLTKLASTNFIHLLDQYTGSNANNRYTYAGGIAESYNTNQTLQDQDIYNIVYSAASQYGTGYGHIYHVFLPSGVSQCSQSAGGCYGQQYCAYHGAVDFSDIGHTLYSVEPYQGISGCMSPNNRLADSTNSTLSHELYETITDPDVQSNVAWYNNTYGEIGDICRFSYGYISVGGTSFDIQKEYSNRYHACSFSP